MRLFYHLAFSERPKVRGGKAVEAAAPGAKISGFTVFSLGEGIEKKEEDFAAEVAAAAGT